MVCSVHPCGYNAIIKMAMTSVIWSFQSLRVDHLPHTRSRACTRMYARTRTVFPSAVCARFLALSLDFLHCPHRQCKKSFLVLFALDFLHCPSFVCAEKSTALGEHNSQENYYQKSHSISLAESSIDRTNSQISFSCISQEVLSPKHAMRNQHTSILDRDFNLSW
jgi:hypothetical protein